MFRPGIDFANVLLTLLSLTTSLAGQWQQASPSILPGTLRSPAMAAANGAVLMFGGDTGSFSSPFSSSTWRYVGDWTLLPLAVSPTGRSEARMVYDSQRAVYVLYGGWNSSSSIGSAIDETWEFNGFAWGQRSPTTSPGGLWKHAMCFDSQRNVTVLFSGAPSGLAGAVNQTWEYNGTTWTQITTIGTPGPRENAAMCFDANLGQSVLFGGADPLGSGATNQTWLYNGSVWQLIPQTGTWPSARSGMEIVYDPVRRVGVMTGGVDNIGNALSDTWEFNGLSLLWTQQPTLGPSGRNFGMAFDTVGRRALRHGGTGNSGQTWLYGASDRVFGSGCAGSNGTPMLDGPDAPRLGQTYLLQLANLNPTIPIAVLVLSLSETPPTPLGVIGMPGCEALVTPDLLISIANNAGVASWSALVPNTLALLGVSLFAQGLSIDPGINAASLTVSNAHMGLLGH